MRKYFVVAVMALFLFLPSPVKAENSQRGAVVTNWQLYQASVRVYNQTCAGISLTRYDTRCSTVQPAVARLERAGDRSPHNRVSWLRKHDARRIYRNICGVVAAQTPACRRLKSLL